MTRFAAGSHSGYKQEGRKQKKKKPRDNKDSREAEEQEEEQQKHMTEEGKHKIV